MGREAGRGGGGRVEVMGRGEGGGEEGGGGRLQNVCQSSNFKVYVRPASLK